MKTAIISDIVVVLAIGSPLVIQLRSIKTIIIIMHRLLPLKE